MNINAEEKDVLLYSPSLTDTTDQGRSISSYQFQPAMAGRLIGRGQYRSSIYFSIPESVLSILCVTFPKSIILRTWKYRTVAQSTLLLKP